VTHPAALVQKQSVSMRTLQTHPEPMKHLPSLLTLLALGASVALAADPEKAFKKLDTDGDGAISLEEFKAGPAGKKDASKIEALFKKKDKDGDGKLSPEEMHKAKGDAKNSKDSAAPIR
jgi:hypothetical protein